MISIKSVTSNRDLPHHGLSRGSIRSLLKKGGSQNACAFTQAAICYLDFLSEYFYLIGYSDEGERLNIIESTLLDCWKYAPYIRRVSDFERLLGVLLEKRSSPLSMVFEFPHDKLGQLNHTQRFLLVARTLQNWSYRGMHLATRIKKHEITGALTELKCTLIGFEQQPLKTSQKILLLRVNDLLEGKLKPRESMTIEKELIEQPLIRQFKADWLSYRCELAEFKQQAFFEQSVIDSFKERLIEIFQTVPINQPNFRDNLINQFSFSRIPNG